MFGRDKGEGGEFFDTVTQEWTMSIPLKMQTVLFASIRGPDHAWAPMTKQLNRWMRTQIVKNGNSVGGDHSDFMRVEELPYFDGDFERELEYLPVHYYHHLILSLEIIGYKHPDEDVRDVAMYYYRGLVEMLHMTIELEDHMDWRLEDNPGELRDPPPAVPEALKNINFPPPPPPDYRSSGY